uniref:Putative ovule protein n=1 Tax=Solanum chacoense TaxID=4108 RepID=A0A0V0GLM2_SOLCH
MQPNLVGNPNKNPSASTRSDGNDISGIESSLSGACIFTRTSSDIVSGALYSTPSTPSMVSIPFLILLAKLSTCPYIE